MEGFEARPLEAAPLAFAHFHGLEHPQEALRRTLELDPGALQEVDEGGRRAVQDRHFLGGDVDIEVVDAEAGAGRHQVLHRVHARRARVAVDRQGRGQPRVRHRGRRRRDFHRHGQVHAPEDDAGVGRGGTQRQFDTLPAVQADADRPGQRLEGTLLEHDRNSMRRGETLPPRGAT
jgi:hypothetical protein